MPARTRKVKLDQKHKDSIRASQLLNRLANHALKDVPMSNSQVNAADKALSYLRPKMAAIEHKGEIETQYIVRMPTPARDLAEWTTTNTKQDQIVSEDKPLTTH